MAERHAPQAEANRREHPRRQVRIPGVLLYAEREEPCTVFDISPRGANLSASDDVPINHPIRLKLTRHGEFVGRIVWRRGDRMGMRFVHMHDEPIDSMADRATVRLRKRGE